MATKPEKERARRSQEQRRRETTNKLIEATIDVINESGYGGLKATEITRKAGVTWGAVQHLFGDKENLLLTVASRTYEELSAALRTDITPSASMSERVEQIVGVTWRAYQSDAYLAMVEILRGSRAQKAFHKELVDRQQTLNDDVRRTWLRLFANAGVDENVIDGVRDLVTLTLSGLAARRIFLRIEKEARPVIAMLNHAALSALLGDAPAPRQRASRASVMV